jgi:hypothetical protein
MLQIPTDVRELGSVGGHHLHQLQLGQRVQHRPDVGVSARRRRAGARQYVRWPAPQALDRGAMGAHTDWYGGPPHIGLAHLRPTTTADEWAALCAQVLRANTGMALSDFLALLEHAYADIASAALAPPAAATAALGRRRSSQGGSVHDRRQWALLQLLKVAQALAGTCDADMATAAQALVTSVHDAMVRDGCGLSASVQPPRADLDTVALV